VFDLCLDIGGFVGVPPPFFSESSNVAGYLPFDRKTFEFIFCSIFLNAFSNELKAL
jgi:hypothetical protein